MNGGPLEDVGAIVLCGGKSRRMGRAKATLPFGPDEVLLQRVARIGGEVASAIVVVAAPDQELPPLPESVRIVRDPIADRGPLQGIAAGLEALPVGIEFAYATATDVPFLAPDWIRLLRERIGHAGLAIPYVGGFHHPLSALYRRSEVAGPIAELLASDRLRPMFLIEAVRAVILEELELRTVDPSLGTLRNLNTPEDYEDAMDEFESLRSD